MSEQISRREVIIATSAVGLAAAATTRSAFAAKPASADEQTNSGSSSGIKVHRSNTALVIIDPQIDVLTEKGTSWDALGSSVTENHTVENIERLFKAAKTQGYEVVISPHYFYPTDNGWKHNGPLESSELQTHTFARRGPLTLEGFRNSGADWVESLKPYIDDGKTVICSPHKVFGPQTNDVVMQLGKRNISKVILGGMLANMCVEAHLRHFLEVGLEVAVIKDATAGPRHPVWGDGYQAAMINYRYLAHAVWTTQEVVERMA